MKIRFFAIALVAMIIGFGSCGGKDKDKSSECNIISFTVGTQAYTPTNDGFQWNYPKTGPDAWATEPSWPVKPQIVISAGAKISPEASVDQTFVKADGSSANVQYTVTAEDGTTKKTYTVRATKSMEL